MTREWEKPQFRTVSDKKVKSFPGAVVLFNWLCSVSSSAITFLFWSSFVLRALFLLTPLWVWVAPRCSFIYRLNSAAAVLYILRAERHNLGHKTIAAGRLLLAFLLSSAFYNLSCIEGETLQSHLFNHGLAVLPSPPENWIPTVVLCDVPVPDKSLTSLRACIWTQTRTRAQLMLAFSGQSDCFCLQLLMVPLSACVFRFQKWK